MSAAKTLIAFSVLGAVCAGPKETRAQSTLVSGDRVRIHRTNTVGQFVFVEQRRDTLVLQNELLRRVAVTVDHVVRIEVKRRYAPARRFVQGSAWGLLWGGSIGALLGLVGPVDYFYCRDRVCSAAVGAAFAAPVGITIGGIVGLVSEMGHWRDVSVASMSSKFSKP